MVITCWLTMTRFLQLSLPARIVALVQNPFRWHYKVRSVFHILTEIASPPRIVAHMCVVDSDILVLDIDSVAEDDCYRGRESILVPPTLKNQT